jgi:hypothetical protein
MGGSRVKMNTPMQTPDFKAGRKLGHLCPLTIRPLEGLRRGGARSLSRSAVRPKTLLKSANPRPDSAFGKLSTICLLDFPNAVAGIGFGKLSRLVPGPRRVLADGVRSKPLFGRLVPYSAGCLVT